MEKSDIYIDSLDPDMILISQSVFDDGVEMVLSMNYPVDEYTQEEAIADFQLTVNDAMVDHEQN